MPLNAAKAEKYFRTLPEFCWNLQSVLHTATLLKMSATLLKAVLLKMLTAENVHYSAETCLSSASTFLRNSQYCTPTLLEVLPTLLKPVLLKCLLLKMYTTLLKMLLACRTISAKFQQPPDVLRNGTIVLYLLRTAKPLSVQYCTVLYVR